ncbi:MAG: DUF3781 domain-containing protein [Ruminococcaceae bacterium]|nr:DUF3781 domain-containing protein [Oscillospiraceae bacterium]
MSDKELLLSDIDKLHTTELGVTRIKRNLTLPECDVVEYCKKRITEENTVIYKEGKNFYCENGDERITVNYYSFTIITAHKKK